MKKVLGVFAHPDDEIIWGWPIFQDESLERHLIVVSDNHTGYGERAGRALDDACRAMGAESCTCMNVQSEFYRLSTRRTAFTLPILIRQITDTIDAVLNDVSPDFIVTHNPHGEYGHGDHRLLFNVVTGFFADVVPVIYTDACQWNKCHLSFDKIPTTTREAYYKKKISQHYLRTGWFDEIKAYYVKHRAWSWGEPHVVATKLGLFST